MKKNRGRYTEVTFDLTERDFNYLGGLLDNTLGINMLKTIMVLQSPIEIMKIQHKKYRGVDKYSYRVTVSLHKDDMRDLENTLKYNSNQYKKGDYSQLVSDCIHA